MSRSERILAALAVLPFGLGLTLSGDAPAKGDVVFSFADPEIIESSGLIAQTAGSRPSTTPGDAGRVFTIDPADGTTVAETSWDGEPVDVESMALTPEGDVLVGDTGDNAAERDSIELIRVPFGQDGAVDPTTYELVYPDGAHDCESLLVHPKTGQVLVVAKEFIGRLYAGPEQLDQAGPNRLECSRRGAADRHRRCLLPGREALHPAWLREGGRLRLAVPRPGRRRVLPPDQEQGEGIAVGKDGSVYLSSEGIESDVLEIELPAKVRAAVDPSVEEPDKPGKSDKSDDTSTTIDKDEPAQDVLRPFLPWAIGGAIGLVVLLILLRLRSRAGGRGA